MTAGSVPSPSTRVAEIPVGIEPVSLAALSDSEAWVVNNLSDDVSIVNLNTFHVRATLRVGDEPEDVVLAGTPVRACVSVSQNAPGRCGVRALSCAPAAAPLGRRCARFTS